MVIHIQNQKVFKFFFQNDWQLSIAEIVSIDEKITRKILHKITFIISIFTKFLVQFVFFSINFILHTKRFCNFFVQFHPKFQIDSLLEFWTDQIFICQWNVFTWGNVNWTEDTSGLELSRIYACWLLNIYLTWFMPKCCGL